MKKEFTAVIGSTASGKSALAVALSKKFDGEIVSCDSMQIYKGLDIGTAKPSREEQKEVPHHLIDIADAREDFSAGDYSVLAKKAIDDIVSRGRRAFMCGGTFLYLDSVISVSSLSDASKDEKLRERLETFAAGEGNHALHEKLSKIDPEAAQAIHENNVKRVIRAIEIFETTGVTKTEWDRRSKEESSGYSAGIIKIDYHNRDILYSRINRRVDEMMETGLEKEARGLFERGLLTGKTSASQAIGYKEFVPYFNGEQSLKEAIEQLKQSTRNYAKRQLTWMKKYTDAYVLWGDTGRGEPRDFEEMFSEVKEYLGKKFSE